MMATRLMIPLLFIFVFGCNNEVPKPDNLIPRTEMKAIIKDLYLYKNLNETEKTFKSRKKPDDVNLAVLKMHGISLEQFEESFKYYVIHGASYDKMLIEIQDELKESEYYFNPESIK